MERSEGVKLPNSREALLEAAVELFRARGYEGVGVAELLEASSAPRGSLYFHFPGGKEQIGAEVIGRVAEVTAGQFRELDASKVPIDLYVDLVFRHTAKIVRERSFDASCPIAAVAAEMSTRSPRLVEAVSRCFELWEREIAAAAEARGMAEEDAAAFASAMLVSIEGALVVSKSHRSDKPHLNAARAMKAFARSLLAPTSGKGPAPAA